MRINKSYRGYIIQSYKVIAPQLEFIQGCLVKVKEDDTRKLFCHILASQIIDPWKLAVPVYSLLLKDKLPKADWMELVAYDLIDYSEYSTAANKSRRFWVKPELVDNFIELGNIPTDEEVAVDKFNLFNSRKSNQICKNQKFDKNRNKEPQLITDAIDLINKAFFNLREIEAYLLALENRTQIIKQNLGKEHHKYVSARSAHINDKSCFKSILAQDPIKVTDEIWAYTPAWKVQMSGRVSHIRGGLQSCSREMKAAAYKGVEKLRNYDLKSSQINGLIQQFELAKLDTSWLEGYRDNPNAKYDYAAAVGISVDCWKDCLCSVIFGSYVGLPSKKNKSKLETGEGDLPAVLSYLNEEAEGDINQVMATLVKFMDAVASLKGEIDKWHGWLLDTYVKKMGYRGVGGSLFVKNAAGKILDYTDLQNKLPEWKLKATIAAFVLQGQESAFIHELTLLSLKHDYQVVANEHDGLVTLGSIPDEAVDEAAAKSGLKYCKLEEKPLQAATKVLRYVDAEDDLDIAG